MALLIFDFKTSQILRYYYLYFLASFSWMLNLSANYLLFLYPSPSLSFQLILISLSVEES